MSYSNQGPRQGGNQKRYNNSDGVPSQSYQKSSGYGGGSQQSYNNGNYTGGYPNNQQKPQYSGAAQQQPQYRPQTATYSGQQQREDRGY